MAEAIYWFSNVYFLAGLLSIVWVVLKAVKQKDTSHD